MVGQPLGHTAAVGRLPPLALAVGACRAGHRTVGGRGGWRALTTIWHDGRILLPLQMAIGTQPSFETAVRSYFCQCWIRLFIFVKSKKNKKNSEQGLTLWMRVKEWSPIHFASEPAHKMNDSFVGGLTWNQPSTFPVDWANSGKNEWDLNLLGEGTCGVAALRASYEMKQSDMPCSLALEAPIKTIPCGSCSQMLRHHHSSLPWCVHMKAEQEHTRASGQGHAGRLDVSAAPACDFG
jgi:hypothetical protein